MTTSHTLTCASCGASPNTPGGPPLRRSAALGRRSDEVEALCVDLVAAGMIERAPEQ